MTQIVRCRVENILGIKSAEFAPMGESVTIGGRNGQGKSSAIRALTMALGGKRQVPEKPVHGDQAEGFVTIELDSFALECRIDSDRELKLVAKTKDGIRLHSPKQMLDSVFSGISFDPGEFRSMEKEKQARTLLALAKLDFTELDKKHKELYDERTVVGREVSTLQGKLAGLELVKDAPAEEVSIVDLTETMLKWENIILGIARANKEIAAKYERSKVIRGRIEVEMNQIESLRASIESLEKSVAQKQAENKALHIEIEGDERRLEAAVDEYQVRPEEARDAALEAMKNAEQINRCVRHNKVVRAQLHELASKTALRLLLTDQMTEIEDKRAEMLRDAQFPIAGLSFIDGHITYNGVIFSQLSESEQWEVSTAISFALNPKGIVFMSQSGGLDRFARDRIRERAAQLGVQLFLEVVDDADDVQILIEDGTVKEDRIAVVEQVVTT